MVPIQRYGEMAKRFSDQDFMDAVKENMIVQQLYGKNRDQNLRAHREMVKSLEFRARLAQLRRKENFSISICLALFFIISTGSPRSVEIGTIGQSITFDDGKSISFDFKFF